MNKKQLVAMGNIHRTSIPEPEKRINLYIGNNVMGANIDAVGSMEDYPDAIGVAITDVNHRRHYCNAYFGMEYKVPLLRHHFDVHALGKSLLAGDFEIRDYEQHLFITVGVAETGYTLYCDNQSIASVKLRQYFSFADKTDFHCDVQVEPLCPDVKIEFSIEAVVDYPTHYNFHYRGFSEQIDIAGTPSMKISTGATWTTVSMILDENADVQREQDKICTFYACDKPLTLHLGYIAVNKFYCTEPEKEVYRYQKATFEQLWTRHEARWDEYWGKSILDIRAAKRLQVLWLRSFYYFAISEPDHEDNISSPSGLAGSRSWPFAFPQDYSFVFQNFLYSNHLEIASATASYWGEFLDDIVAYTKRLLNVDGAFVPWCIPNTSYNEFNAFGTPNKFYYELHNSAYAVTMCYNYYRYTKDEAYLRNVAVPVLTQIARFYRNISTFNPSTGKYEIRFTPITGQNEQGSHNMPNNLCCLTSAQYSVDRAVEIYEIAGLEPEPEWLDVSQRGYDFDVTKVNGKMLSYEGASPDEVVGPALRLNNIAFVPIRRLYESQDVKDAYLERYEWVRGAKNHIWGWNLGELLMAGVRLRDDEGVQHDINELLNTSTYPNPYLDWDDVQIFEYGGARIRPYFITSHGMVSAAISEMALSCFADECILFSIVLDDLREAGFCFVDFLTPFGFSISASWKQGEIHAELKATRPEDVKIRLCHADKTHVVRNQDGEEVCRSSNQLLQFRTQAGCTYHIAPIM